MTSRRKFGLLIGAVILVCLAIPAWLLMASATTFRGAAKKYVLIPSKTSDKQDLMRILETDSLLRFPGFFDLAARRTGYWKEIRPGRYAVPKGTSTLGLLRLLQKGQESPVKMVLNKFRLKEDFARYAGRQLETDSADIMQLLLAADSLARFQVDTHSVMTLIIPNTYEFYWTSSPKTLISRLHREKEKFWTAERLAKARALGLTPVEVSVLASIVEEETNKQDEKPVIASVYLNRLRKGMNLGADPTVKFALRDFNLKRIRFKHIDAATASPYNTYRQKGLPPGPICTPSVKSIDAVLDADSTDYLFFCARPDFSGYHAFASNETEHFRNAAAFQRALDSLQIK